MPVPHSDPATDESRPSPGAEPRPLAGLSYVVPLFWTQDNGLVELAAYLRGVADRAEVIVVDGSPPARFDAHVPAFAGFARHITPHADLNFIFGKVNNVTTGVRESRHEHVILADDDVRYEPGDLERIDRMLATAAVVRPQNYFDPLPWHARWDTARTLLNRAFGGDYPGTLGIRRSHFLAMGGYDGDVLFENLELMRTVRASGGRVASPLDLYVRRMPPSAAHFLSQRVRQAYDDFALPGRMALWLSVVPTGAALLQRRRYGLLGLGVAVAPVAIAEAGRRRAGGRRVFPPSTSWFAPLWLTERAVCAWVAVANRALRGGQPYGAMRIARAATPPRQLRRAHVNSPSWDDTIAPQSAPSDRHGQPPSCR
jgi:glycosyl transferase family 21